MKTTAVKNINESSLFLRTGEDQKIFIDVILNPPASNETLKDAQLKYFKENQKAGRSLNK